MREENMKKWEVEGYEWFYKIFTLISLTLSIINSKSSGRE